MALSLELCLHAFPVDDREAFIIKSPRCESYNFFNEFISSHIALDNKSKVQGNDNTLMVK